MNRKKRKSPKDVKVVLQLVEKVPENGDMVLTRYDLINQTIRAFDGGFVEMDLAGTFTLTAGGRYHEAK